MPKKILIVEEGIPLALKEAQMLKKHGFDATTVHSADEALKAVERDSVDLILMDIDLGNNESDGAEAAQAILKNYTIPIIFITGHAEKEYARKVKDIPSYGYVLKDSGEFVLIESVKIAFKLFKAQKKGKKKRQKTIKGLKKNIRQLEKINIEEQYAVNRQLKERVKELNCLYSISKIVEAPDISLDGILQKTADVIPKSWLYPEITVCRITHNGKEYRSEGFEITPWRIRSGLTVDGEKTCAVEVYYLKEKPDIDEGPFLKEERKLIDAVAERLGMIIERKQYESRLHQTIAEKDFLMREINHRVKNNLGMVSSLIYLKESMMEGSVDLSDLIHQVEAVRIVHEKLYQSEDIIHIDFREYIQDLLSTVFSFHPVPVKINNKIMDIRLDADKAVLLGLIINEIATNAMQHGFSGTEEPVFTVTLEKTSSQNGYALTLANNGKPFPEDVKLDNPDTLGLRLISSFTDQLEGTMKLTRKPHPVFVIRFL